MCEDVKDLFVMNKQLVEEIDEKVDGINHAVKEVRDQIKKK